MRDSPYFSVVVPVYNKEPHIKRSIGSVLNQTFEQFELLIICDPSTDNSEREVRQFEDPRIRIFTRDVPGPGGYAARNLGIANARARWIAFLDADDEWHPEHLEQLYAVHVRFPAAEMLSTGWQTFEDDKYELDPFSRETDYDDCLIDFRHYVQLELQGRRPICTLVACIKKSVLVEAGMFPSGKITMGGDVDTWLRCVYAAKYLAWRRAVGATYFRNAVNMVTRTSTITPELHRLTACSLIKKTQTKKTQNLLKRRSNYMVLRAWFHNLCYAENKNFTLYQNLFLDVNPILGLMHVFFSFLPRKVAIRIHWLVRFMRSARKKVRTSLKKKHD